MIFHFLVLNPECILAYFKPYSTLRYFCYRNTWLAIVLQKVMPTIGV